MKHRPTERTAAEAYLARRASINAHLARLTVVLQTFDEWHRESPNDWSVIGDAGAVDIALTNLLASNEAAETWHAEGWGKKAGGK